MKIITTWLILILIAGISYHIGTIHGVNADNCAQAMKSVEDPLDIN